MLPVNIRERVKLWCLTSGMTQVKIAEKLGVSKQDIAHVCAGNYRGGRVVESVCDLMGVTKEWLIDGKGKPPEWAGEAPSPTIELASPPRNPRNRLRWSQRQRPAWQDPLNPRATPLILRPRAGRGPWQQRLSRHL